MHLAIDQPVLDLALRQVRLAVTPKSPIAIYTHCKLSADTHTLSIAGVNGTFELAAKIELADDAVIAPGELTTPAHPFADIVKRLPSDRQINLAADEERARLHVYAEAAQFTLPRLPAVDFPKISASDMPCRFSLAGSELAELLRHTVPATATDDARPWLQGCYLHPAKDAGTRLIRVVATDGHRLARADCVHDGSAELPGLILPRETAVALNRLIREAPATANSIDIAATARLIRFVIPGEHHTLTLTSKVVDASYPEYEQAIPRHNDKRIRLNRRELNAVLERVTVCADKHHELKIDIAAGWVTCSTHNGELATASDRLATLYDGPAITIGFNWKFLTDFLSVLDGEDIELCLRDSETPAVLRDPDASGALYLIVPVRLNAALTEVSP
jgi:DNA polymerase-3 subunit beta